GLAARFGRKRPGIEAGDHSKPYDTPLLRGETDGAARGGTAAVTGPAGEGAAAARRGAGGGAGGQGASRARAGGGAGRQGGGGGRGDGSPRGRPPGRPAGPSSSPSPGRATPATRCRRRRCCGRARPPGRGPRPMTW